MRKKRRYKLNNLFDVELHYKKYIKKFSDMLRGYLEIKRRN